MKKKRLLEIKKIYEYSLFEDIIPFWEKHSLDRNNGGYFNYLDRDGTILSSDKSVWIQARQVWIFSRLYNTFEKNKKWIEASELGYKFLKNFCFDKDKRMFFQVTSDGRPLRKRRYWFSEAFTVIAFAEYYSATGNIEALNNAKEIYKIICDFYDNPLKLPAKIDPGTRPLMSHSPLMILLSTSQSLREVDDDSIYGKVISKCIDDLFKFFLKGDDGVLLETVGGKGEIINNPDGRTINPGHSIETAWFLLREGLYRNDNYILEKALNILKSSLEKGWDKE